ncbi:hypothetical protein MCOR11_006757 [Pyricularia oryzae]|nr:hypothetical protein MCOR01_001756 [Pyricularia oryzae]KAI6401375.1 hypothetical protein MCOR20_008106 [Pyricularia oryzae]KAI6492278.1 hypothetical protein MCOR11_006757 [Pyricularia oryzae]
MPSIRLLPRKKQKKCHPDTQWHSVSVEHGHATKRLALSREPIRSSYPRTPSSIPDLEYPLRFMRDDRINGRAAAALPTAPNRAGWSSGSSSSSSIIVSIMVASSIGVLLAAVLLGGTSTIVTAAPVELELNVTALTPGIIDSDWTAAYYPKSGAAPLLLANDAGTATGGFRVFGLEGAPTLSQAGHVIAGRTKLVAPLYNASGAGDDFLVTIATTESVVRLYSLPDLAVVPIAEPLVTLGDWNAVCSWGSYFFLFGKGGRAFQYLVRPADGGSFEVLEVRALPAPVVFVGCAVSPRDAKLYLTEDVDQDVYVMDVGDMAGQPTLKKVKGVKDATGIALYSSGDKEYVFVAQESQLSVYGPDWTLLGTVQLAGLDDIEIQGLSIYQAQTSTYPSGAITFAIEADATEGFGTTSLQPILDALSIPPNTAYTPRSEPTGPRTCARCSDNGFCPTVGCPKTCTSCLLGFSGPTCSTPRCEADCSGRGTCVGPNKCACDAGWGGLHCSFVLVEADRETDAAGGDGDDPAVWISPVSKELSRVITTVKSEAGAGLNVFDLEGKLVQQFTAGQPNNVDVIYGFKAGDRVVDLAFAGCRSDETLCLFEITSNGTITTIPGGIQPLPKGYKVYGSCVYRSPKSNRQYLFVNSKKARYLQYELTSTESGTLQTTLVRDFTGGSGGQVEGCVVDDRNSWLFLGEEPRALWRYGAEPDDGTEGLEIAVVGDGKLNAEVEGVTLVEGKTPQEGYILVSNQGVSSYAVYRRAEPHEYVATFAIVASANGKIDAVSNTDGITAVATGLGPNFPHGLVVVHDDANQLPEGGTSTEASFKMISLEKIFGGPLKELNLLDHVDANWDPRA